MSILAWLAIPVATSMLAALWGWWTHRPRGPVDPAESISQFERFRAAMGEHEHTGS